MTDRSLQYVPDYAAALLARGRIQLARAEFLEAAATLEKAARLNPLPEYRWAFADVLRSLKRIDEAVAVERQLVQQGADDPRTLALYWPAGHLSFITYLCIILHTYAIA